MSPERNGGFFDCRSIEVLDPRYKPGLIEKKNFRNPDKGSCFFLLTKRINDCLQQRGFFLWHFGKALGDFSEVMLELLLGHSPGIINHFEITVFPGFSRNDFVSNLVQHFLRIIIMENRSQCHRGEGYSLMRQVGLDRAGYPSRCASRLRRIGDSQKFLGT